MGKEAHISDKDSTERSSESTGGGWQREGAARVACGPRTLGMSPRTCTLQEAEH